MNTKRRMSGLFFSVVVCFSTCAHASDDVFGVGIDISPEASLEQIIAECRREYPDVFETVGRAVQAAPTTNLDSVALGDDIVGWCLSVRKSVGHSIVRQSELVGKHCKSAELNDYLENRVGLRFNRHVGASSVDVVSSEEMDAVMRRNAVIALAEYETVTRVLDSSSPSGKVEFVAYLGLFVSVSNERLGNKLRLAKNLHFSKMFEDKKEDLRVRLVALQSLGSNTEYYLKCTMDIVDIMRKCDDANGALFYNAKRNIAARLTNDFRLVLRVSEFASDREDLETILGHDKYSIDRYDDEMRKKIAHENKESDI